MPIVTRAPSDFEQLMLEYINRARADPEGEFDVFIADAATGTGVQENITSALDFFGVDLDVFLAQISVLPSVAPLAWNSALALAADGHTQALIDADAQSHQLPGELPLDERIEAEGYVNWSYLNENVYSYMQDPLHGHAAFFIDWGYGPDGMQDPPGHRDTIMASYLTEVGISVMAAPDGPSVGPWVVTQDFGSTWGYQAQLVGVVIDDADGDRFYDMGEGMGGVTVTATSSSGQVYTTTSWDSGGYQMVLPEGSYTVRFSGGALSGVLSYQLEMGGENAKLDGVAQDGSSVPDVVLGTPDSEILTALDGYGQILIGNGGADVLVGAADDNTLIGDAVDAAGLPELGAQVYRLYLATLDRVPDPTGHDSWTERLLTGEKTLLQAAGGFVNSTEFQNTYGSLDNEAFVTLLYQNVLDRDPDATGLANWVARLEDGMSRAQVVLGFSQSPEFIAETTVAAQLYAEQYSVSTWGDDVFRLYQATLDRDPDFGGFSNWSTRLADGMSYLDVAAGFVNSPEFQNTYGSLDNEGFVTLLYWNVLDRAPDATGLASWVARLEDGMSRTEVVRGFAQSAEFQIATADDFELWMRVDAIDDRLSSGGGSDLMVGGAFADTFVIAAGDSVTIADFEPWDTLELTGFSLAGEPEILAAFREVGDDLVLTADGTSLVLQDMDLAMLATHQLMMI